MNKVRQSVRTQVDMNLRSVQLPRYAAKIVDLSDKGAKLRLNGVPAGSLEDARIRFSAALPVQVRQAFEGYARVAWVKETAAGVFAGLEFEKMSKSAWVALKASLYNAAV